MSSTQTVSTLIAAFPLFILIHLVIDYLETGEVPILIRQLVNNDLSNRHKAKT